MSKRQILVFLCNDGVDAQGRLDPLVQQELPWLSSRFQRIWLVCHRGVADLSEAAAWQGETIALRRSPLGAVAAVQALFSPDCYREVQRLRRDHRLSLVNAAKVVAFGGRGRKMHLWLEGLLRSVNARDVVLYAYWMSYEAYGAALSKRKHPRARLVVRGHAFEIDIARNPLNPYLMKGIIAKYADGLFLISEYAKAQFLGYMEGRVDLEKLRVVGVGCRGTPAAGCGKPPMQEDGILHVVSCAAIGPVKQLPLLIDALAGFAGQRLHWHHMGGGPQEAQVRAYAMERLGDSPTVTYEITGRLASAQVEETYQSNAFDVFINTSRMEGVPVSIMEAMRYGIPVIAPKVGGIPELVDKSFGLLYAPEGGAEAVGEALQQFASLPMEEVMKMRQAAQTHWNQSCRSEELLSEIFEVETPAKEDAARD